MQSDIGRFGSNWGLTSIDYSDNNSLHFSQVSLSTHKEECEDDRSSHQPSDDLVEQVNGFWSGEDASSLVGQSRSLVDLIQVGILLVILFNFVYYSDRMLVCLDIFWFEIPQLN